jgi:hypothetical protein
MYMQERVQWFQQWNKESLRLTQRLVTTLGSPDSNPEIAGAKARPRSGNQKMDLNQIVGDALDLGTWCKVRLATARQAQGEDL